LIALR